jgi:cysteine desulfurase
MLEVLNLKNHNLIFTSNATEANNLGIYGVVSKYKKGKLITTKIEHASVYEVFKSLENDGFEVVYLDVDEKGVINLKQLEDNIDKETILVSIMWVNNIVGAIQPINKIIEIVKRFPKTKLHIDMVQGLCKITPNFEINDIDLFTFSAHKIFGPKGIGILGCKKNIE